MRTGMEDRLTDRRGEGGNGERRNVKAGALEVILAGNLSYHSDLVKALQQVRGERGRQREREQRIVSHCLGLSWYYFEHGRLLNDCVHIEAQVHD